MQIFRDLIFKIQQEKSNLLIVIGNCLHLIYEGEIFVLRIYHANVMFGELL
nr:hypothetical protein [Borreliella sinica]WPM05737.1 hypothetical protein QIA41_01295 [Borreliella sinica]